MTEQERQQCVAAGIGITGGARDFAKLFTATLGREVTPAEALAVIETTRHRKNKRGMDKKMKVWRSF